MITYERTLLLYELVWTCTLFKWLILLIRWSETCLLYCTVLYFSLTYSRFTNRWCCRYYFVYYLCCIYICCVRPYSSNLGRIRIYSSRLGKITRHTFRSYLLHVSIVFVTRFDRICHTFRSYLSHVSILFVTRFDSNCYMFRIIFVAVPPGKFVYHKLTFLTDKNECMIF